MAHAKTADRIELFIENKLHNLKFPISLTKKYSKMLKFGIKSAILGSAIYYTVDKGVWKDSATTTALYEELESGVSPYVGDFKKQIPYELPPLPSNDRLTYLFKYYWNSGVKTTFKFIIDLPSHTTNVATKAYEFVSTVIEPVEPSITKDAAK